MGGFDEVLARSNIDGEAIKTIASAMGDGTYGNDVTNRAAQFAWRRGQLEAEEQTDGRLIAELAGLSKGQRIARVLHQCWSEIVVDRAVPAEQRRTENVRLFCGLIAMSDAPATHQLRLITAANGIFDTTKKNGSDTIGDKAERTVQLLLLQRDEQDEPIMRDYVKLLDQQLASPAEQL